MPSRASATFPRHIHVTVDDAPWRWADASGEPLIINGLPAGPHKVLIEARQREPPDPRQGDPHLRDPVRGRALGSPPLYVNTSFGSLRNGGIRTRRFPAASSWTPPSSGHRRSR